MTPAPYKGPERRTDEVSVRLALLERESAAAKERDAKTQESLAAVHKRISETRDKISADVKEGFAAVIKKIDDQQTARMADKKEQGILCKDCADSISRLKENRKWMYAWVSAAWGAILTGAAWIFQHASKVDQNTARQAADALKNLKVGG